MLIRFASHQRWILLFALGSVGAFVAAWLACRHDPDGLTGGSFSGLWFGVAGAFCIIFAGLLPLLRQRAVLRWKWVGQRQFWLRGHIWLGLLSVVFVALHSGLRFRGELVLALSVVFFLTVLTGVAGLIVQEWLPRRLTSYFPGEVPLGQLSEVCRKWREVCDLAVDKVCSPIETKEPAAPRELLPPKGRIRAFYEEQVRPFLGEGVYWRWPLFNPVASRLAFEGLRDERGLSNEEEELVKEMEKVCAWRRAAAQQQRQQALLHAWLLVHVPVSTALLVLALAHSLTALWY